ncbi:homoserine kinase [Fodinicola acaciae]|uniref:homoserine kinase n=1 Tax=Fodinicola acaciae TaxID=2681555 RepID=UPI0013D05069|nr:homoserine kinase [Fodinicola acaciae]
MARAYEPARVRVRVPASSANLGPGFDAVGLALGLHDEVDVAIVPSGLDIEVTGEGAGELPNDEKHLLVRAARHAFDRLGGQPSGLRLRCHNRIPHGRGLGSSAAAIVAGLVGASALAGTGHARGELPDDELLCLANELEGHPDNVAACLLGAATIAWMDGDQARAVRLEPHADLAPVAFIPTGQFATETARGLLPAEVPHADAAANAGRAALLAYALTADLSVLYAATEDRLHQSYRAVAMPESMALVDRLRAAGVPAVISGAGATVLALTSGNGPAVEVLESYAPKGISVVPLPVDLSGSVAQPV